MQWPRQQSHPSHAPQASRLTTTPRRTTPVTQTHAHTRTHTHTHTHTRQTTHVPSNAEPAWAPYNHHQLVFCSSVQGAPSVRVRVCACVCVRVVCERPTLPAAAASLWFLCTSFCATSPRSCKSLPISVLLPASTCPNTTRCRPGRPGAGAGPRCDAGDADSAFAAASHSLRHTQTHTHARQARRTCTHGSMSSQYACHPQGTECMRASMLWCCGCHTWPVLRLRCTQTCVAHKCMCMWMWDLLMLTWPVLRLGCTQTCVSYSRHSA